MSHDCCCVPTALGFYWATWTQYNRRVVVEVAKNGNKHIRAYIAGRYPRSHDLCDFRDWSKRLKDPGVRKKVKRG